jgi:hypothetical protein
MGDTSTANKVRSVTCVSNTNHVTASASVVVVLLLHLCFRFHRDSRFRHVMSRKRSLHTDPTDDDEHDGGSDTSNAWSWQRRRTSTDHDAKRARQERSRKERIYCMQCIVSEDAHIVTLSVEGQSGMLYTVHGITTDASKCMDMSCSCPDFEKRQEYCKHIYYSLERVFRLPPNTSLCVSDAKAYQIRLISESQEMSASRQALFSERPASAASAASAAAAAAAAASFPNVAPVGSKEPEKVPQRDYLGDDCAVCCEELTQDDQVAWCTVSCGKSFHSDCLQRWHKHNPTCPLCNATHDTHLL